MTAYRIEKRAYSRRPWRLVGPNGQEVQNWAVIEHTTLAGKKTACMMPVAGTTRAECESKALALIVEISAQREKARLERDTLRIISRDLLDALQATMKWIDDNGGSTTGFDGIKAIAFVAIEKAMGGAA